MCLLTPSYLSATQPRHGAAEPGRLSLARARARLLGRCHPRDLTPSPARGHAQDDEYLGHADAPVGIIDEKEALRKGDGPLAHQVGEGKDIMSILRKS